MPNEQIKKLWNHNIVIKELRNSQTKMNYRFNLQQISQEILPGGICHRLVGVSRKIENQPAHLLSKIKSGMNPKFLNDLLILSLTSTMETILNRDQRTVASNAKYPNLQIISILQTISSIYTRVLMIASHQIRESHFTWRIELKHSKRISKLLRLWLRVNRH